MTDSYNIKTAQRIIDHWKVGVIKEITHFENIGENIWRHFIDTEQGEFEIYSYLGETKKYSEEELAKYLSDRHGKQNKRIVHIFNRYHSLVQLTKNHKISAKQASKDLDLLIGSTIEKAFRVYGTILQIHLDENDVNKAGVLVSYANWSMQEIVEDQPNTIIDSIMNNYDELDAAVEEVEQQKPTIAKTVLKDGWFEVYLSNNLILRFTRVSSFPAIEVTIPTKKEDILIFDGNNIFYRISL